MIENIQIINVFDLFYIIGNLTYHGSDNRIPSTYRVNIITQETDQIKNGSYQTGIFNLKWANDEKTTNFVYEVELDKFSNSWAAFSFSGNGKMVKLKTLFFKT